MILGVYFERRSRVSGVPRIARTDGGKLVFESWRDKIVINSSSSSGSGCAADFEVAAEEGSKFSRDWQMRFCFI